MELFQKLQEKKVKSHAALQYEPGVIAAFQNVHPQTQSKTLRILFELLAPVSFVDYSYGKKRGYVRFKSAYGAQLACSYFEREFVGQSHGGDTGSLLTSKVRKEKQKERLAEIKKEFISEQSGQPSQLQSRAVNSPRIQ